MAKFNHLGKAAALTVMGALGVTLPYNAMAAESIEAALKESTAKLSLRPRYEKVDQSDASGDHNIAEALTLKTRLTYSTGSFYDVSAVLEFDDVTSLKTVDYNDGTNGLATEPKIIDPEGTEVNQAFLSYKGLDSTDIRWGRQRILLDNQRFIGGVGWRQNEQTYGAISAKNTTVENLSIFLAHVSNVQRIVGESVEAGEHSHDTNLFNVNYKFGDIGALSAYYYDIDNEDDVDVANTTMGVRFAGASTFGAFTLGYEVEYADQEETGDNPTEYSADYTLLGVTGTISKFTFGLAQETLGADEDAAKGFTTSLATGHKFQGWADKFLGTPASGVEDTYLTFKAGLPWGLSFIAVYHQFESAEDVVSGSDFGSEIDAALTKKFESGATLQLKYADFSGEDDAAHGAARTDVNKLWITATYAI